ncbi:MAG: hypothetical protein WCG84_01965 [Candidatus Moraniibacteriota bacterium]
MKNKKSQRSFQKELTHWLSIIIVGMTVGVGVQFTQAWTNPSATPPAGNVAGPITTGSGAQFKAGALTLNNGLTISQAGGAYSTLTLKDNDSPNGVKHIYADGNNIGFLGGDANWLLAINQAGDSWQKRNVGANDYYIRSIGMWASQLRAGTLAAIATDVNNINNAPGDQGFAACGTNHPVGEIGWVMACGSRWCKSKGYAGGMVQEWSGLQLHEPVSVLCVRY